MARAFGVVVGLLAIIAVVVGIVAVEQFLYDADASGPRVEVGDLVTDGKFDSDAWTAAIATDDVAIERIEVTVACGQSQTVVFSTATKGHEARFSDALPDPARNLTPGRCTLTLEAWDAGRGGAGKVTRGLFVYPDGTVADDALDDAVAPHVAGLGRVGSGLSGWSRVRVQDDGSGVRAVAVSVTCGGTPAVRSIVGRRQALKLGEVAPQPTELVADAGCVGAAALVVVATDWSGNQTTDRLPIYVYSSGVTTERALAEDLLPPTVTGFDGADLRRTLVVRDPTAGVAFAALALECGGARYDGPEVTVIDWKRRVAPAWPARVPAGACALTIKVRDHAGHVATVTDDVIVDADGRVTSARNRVDQTPPTLHGATAVDLAASRWTDDGSGLAEVFVATICEASAPIVHRVPASGSEGLARLDLLAPGELKGRCTLVLAAIDGAGLATSQRIDLFAYADGTVVDGSTIDDDTAGPVVVGLEGARRLDDGEWSAVHVEDVGSGIAQVTVEACGQRVERRFDGVVHSFALADLITPPGACRLVVTVVDHAANTESIVTRRLRLK